MSDDDGAELLGAAAALRWSRPDLSAALADHVLEVAAADALDGSWLRAAGWAIHARSATGDGRERASDILDGLVERGTHLLDHPAADLLRVELAVLAAGAERPAAARTLLTPVTVADTTPELRADALCALARCAMQDRPSSVPGLISRVEATWAEIGGRRGDVGSAVASLVAASAERRAGRAAAAVDRAAAGLACLDRAQGARSESPSSHVAAGLAAEWISGLLEAGRVEEAREGCAPLGPRLRGQARPSRQLALLRLTVARTIAITAPGSAAAALENAARDAAGSDAPDLESVCWSTLAALQEKSRHGDRALESVRLGLDAQQRDARRGARFRAALDAVVHPSYADDDYSADHHTGENDTKGHRVHNGADVGPRSVITGLLGSAEDDAVTASGGAWTDWSAAIERDRPPGLGAASGPGQHLIDPRRGARRNDTGGGRRRAGADQPRDADVQGLRRGPNGAGRSRGGREDDEWESGPVAEPVGAGDPWLGWTDESPIGRFLAESRRRADELEQQGRVPGLDERPAPVTPGVEPGPQPGRFVEPVPQPERPVEPAPQPERPVEPDPQPGRPANPWSTGSWAAQGWGRPEPSAGWFPSDAAPRTAGSGGRRRRADPDDTAALTVLPEPHRDGPAAPAETGSGSWLKEAMAELDRALSAPPPAAPDAEGCVVVIDLARDGRRFAGRRAGAVVRAVADQLTGRLPAGARLRHDDADALSVVLPRWNRSAATDWMHGTLPEAFENVAAPEELPGTRFRAAVHDIDGPVGAQLLQRLHTGPARSVGRDGPSTGPLWGDPPDAAGSDGRHGAGGVPFRVEDAGPLSVGNGGRRRRKEDPAAPLVAEHRSASTGGSDVGDDLASTDGLGLADLLAGALAAYRSI